MDKIKIPIMYSPVAQKPIGFVTLDQALIDKYAEELVDLNMAYEKKWNKITGEWDIIPHSFSFIPRI